MIAALQSSSKDEQMRLLTLENAKTIKGQAWGYLTGILYLTPSDGSGLGNLCPFASKGCREACLYTAGYGKLQSVKQARLNKTKLFFENSVKFADILTEDISELVRKAWTKNLKLAVRLNGTSDIPWERIKNSRGITLMQNFHDIQFYDYTKRPDRRPGYHNYHLTFSRSECNEDQCKKELDNGRNVAVVFNVKKGTSLPEKYGKWPVIDGDLHDLRFLDPRGIIVGLRAKGDAIYDKSGFVI